MKKCPLIAYKLNVSDICTQENKMCVITRKASLWSTSLAREHMRCPCPEEHSYECDSKYCVSDSDVCHAFKSKNITFTVYHGKNLLQLSLF
jgi:hypothetical protein